MEYSHFAKAAYFYDKPFHTFNGYERVESDKYSSVFYNAAEHRTILAFTGTQDLEDLVPDYEIAFGKRTHPRWQQALNRWDMVTHKYPNVTVTGHSLGGALARHVSQKRKAQGSVFNEGHGLFTEERDYLQHYRHPLDIVSLANATQSQRYTKPRDSLDLFLEASWWTRMYNYHRI